jgi:hypothetical protein
MTSAINPNNIDGAYPVAGQDNNSQGFRDNFTNTATNFRFAAEEISDLQSKVVLKQALSGTVLDNNMLGSSLSNAVLSNMSDAALALGSKSGSVDIDYSLASYQTLTTSNSVSLRFINFPAAGVSASVVVQVTISDPNHTLTLPTAVSVNKRGIQGAVVSGSGTTISFGTSETPLTTFPAKFSFEFSTSDGGTSITVREVNKRLQPFNNTSENLANAAPVNVAVTTSYFSTVAASTATLAAGVPGQIKTLAMYADGGDMVITVTNAGWKTSGTGTITFNDIGDACTLQYINSNVANIAQSKWFCVGNNGCVFA